MNDGAAARQCFYNDIPKLFRFEQTALNQNAVFKRLFLFLRRRSDRTRRHLRVLFLYSISDIGSGHTERSQLIRLKPDTHGIIIDKSNVVAPLWGIYSYQHQYARVTLSHG